MSVRGLRSNFGVVAWAFVFVSIEMSTSVAQQAGDTCIISGGTQTCYHTRRSSAPPQPPASPSPEELQYKAGLALNLQGIAAEHNGDFVAAIDLYKRALEKIPGDAMIKQNLQNAIAGYNRVKAAKVRNEVNSTAASIATQDRGSTASGLNFSGGSRQRNISSTGLQFSGGSQQTAGSTNLTFSDGRATNRAYGQAKNAKINGTLDFTPSGPNQKPNKPWDSSGGPAEDTGEGVFLGAWHPLPPERENAALRDQHHVIDAAQEREKEVERQLTEAEQAPASDSMQISQLKGDLSKAHTDTLAAQKKYTQMIDMSFSPSPGTPTR